MSPLKRILFLLIFLSPTYVYSQLDLFSNSGNYPGTNVRIGEMPYKPGFKGSHYLDSDWKNADIFLAKDNVKIENVPVRIDIKNKLVEIKYKGEVKVLYAHKTHSLRYNDSKEIFIANNPALKCDLKGFSKLVYSGNSSLLCNYTTKTKEATYNPALNVGEKDREIIKLPIYYAVVGNEVCIKLEKSKKKFRKQFSDEESIFNFIKKNKINPKKEEDLIKFVEFLSARYDSTVR